MSTSIIEETFRAVHSLKGNARALNLESIGERAHKLEDELDKLRSNVAEIQKEFIERTLKALEEFHIEVERYQTLLGNIYKGRVESILPSINAAFVNIGQAKNGFLYLTDVVSPRVDKDQELMPLTFLEKIFKSPRSLAL